MKIMQFKNGTFSEHPTPYPLSDRRDEEEEEVWLERNGFPPQPSGRIGGKYDSVVDIHQHRKEADRWLVRLYWNDSVFTVLIENQADYLTFMAIPTWNLVALRNSLEDWKAAQKR